MDSDNKNIKEDEGRKVWRVIGELVGIRRVVYASMGNGMAGRRNNRFI